MNWEPAVVVESEVFSLMEFELASESEVGELGWLLRS